jgi:hypothetical protein
LQHVDRAKNEEADALAKAAARGEALPSDVFYHVIGTPVVRSPEGLQITNDSEGHRIVNLIMTEDKRAPITLFLQGYYHPTDINEAKRLKHRSRDFTLVEGQLYKANHPHVAPSALGPGHCRATTHCPREPQVHLRRRRVFYRMDRGEGSIHNNIEDFPEILLAKHCLPVRSLVRAHS